MKLPFGPKRRRWSRYEQMPLDDLKAIGRWFSPADDQTGLLLPSRSQLWLLLQLFSENNHNLRRALG